MMNFFKQIKNRISKEDSQPVYRQYSHGELKIIAMRTRMIFEDLYKKQSLKITQADAQFKKVQASNGTIQQQYEVLQQIGKKVLETQMIKLYIEILRKIEAYAPQIINTKGDVALMKQEIKWFQCILWYRKCKKLNNIEEINTFCWNFFKGVDITMELNLKCELFKIYEGLQYLDDDLIIPLDFAVEKIIPYVSFNIDQEQLDEMKKINQEEIRNKEDELNRKKNSENPFYKLPVNQHANNQPESKSIPVSNNQISNPPNRLPYQASNPPQNQYQKSIPSPVISNNNISPIQSQYHSNNNYKKLPAQDDEFALDPYSRVHKPNPNKSFKSNDLNLVDWQAMYKKEKHEQDNPYINNSKIGLLNPDYSVSSEQNSYDETTLPYPPSGVISVQDIGKKDDFFFDTLPRYEPKPVESHIGFVKKPQNKIEDDSFIKSIENQFFSTGPTQQNIANQKPLKPSGSFNEEDLLNEISSSVSQNKKPSQNEGNKSLNKLFGFKFKSNLGERNIVQPKQPQFGSHSQHYGQNRQDTSKSNSKVIDDLLNKLTINANKNPENEIKQSNFDDILSGLNNNSIRQQTENANQHRFSVDQMLRDLNKDSKSNQNSFNAPTNQKDNQHLDEDIKSLIESHKQSLKKQQSRKSSENQYQEMEKQAQNDDDQFNAYQYPDDGQRFNDSKIKFSQEMELIEEFESQMDQQNEKQYLPDQKQHNSNPELHKQNSFEDKSSTSQNQFDYSSLEKDLLDSIKIIKNYYGEQIPSQNNQLDKDSRPEGKFVKKPYMVSIYARKQYMDGLKLAKHQSH